MKMVEEMVPQKIWTCENITRFEETCKMSLEEEEVEEKHPLCEVKSMTKEHKACILEKDKAACKRVLTCKMMKMKEKKKCEKVPTEVVEEQCFDKVMVKKEEIEKEVCSLQPKTLCHDSEGKECKKVEKKMCNYLDTNTV